MFTNIYAVQKKMSDEFTGVQMRKKWMAKREEKSDSEEGRISASRQHSIFDMMGQLEEWLSQD